MTIISLEAKMTFIKKVLNLIGLNKILKFINFDELSATEVGLGLINYLNENMLQNFKFLPELS